MPDPGTSDSDIGRRTPYETVFHAAGLDEGEFAAIQAAAEKIGADPSVRSQFARIAPAAELLERLVPESFETAALDRYLEILFHAFHFWRAGRPIFAFEEELVRRLVERPPELASWKLELRRDALYLELPKNLFWAAVTDAAPEPAEGMFVRSAGPDGEVDVLLVLGMWPDRPGFSAVALSVPAGSASAAPLLDAFHSDLPGADLADLYSLRHAGDAIALLARLIWYVDTHPAAVREVPESEGEDVERAARRTRLAYSRVGLVERRE